MPGTVHKIYFPNLRKLPYFRRPLLHPKIQHRIRNDARLALTTGVWRIHLEDIMETEWREQVYNRVRHPASVVLNHGILLFKRWSNFDTVCSLHSVHRTNICRVDSVCLPYVSRWKPPDGFWLKFGTHVMPFETIPNGYYLNSYNQLIPTWHTHEFVW